MDMQPLHGNVVCDCDLAQKKILCNMSEVVELKVGKVQNPWPVFFAFLYVIKLGVK